MDLARIDSYLNAAVRHFADQLGDELESAHKIGSLAHGGFSAEFSDLDLALMLRRAPAEGVMERLIEEVRSIDPELGSRLSVFWSNRRFEFGRFPILDRADLIDHAVCIHGPALAPLEMPGLADVRAYLLGHPLDYWREKTAHFQRGAPLQRGEAKEYVRCLLYPARLLYTWDTGRLASNDAAVEHLERRSTVPGLKLEPIRAALACRKGEVEFESLLGFHSLLPSQLEASLLALDAGASA